MPVLDVSLFASSSEFEACLEICLLRYSRRLCRLQRARERFVVRSHPGVRSFSVAPSPLAFLLPSSFSSHYLQLSISGRSDEEVFCVSKQHLHSVWWVIRNGLAILDYSACRWLVVSILSFFRNNWRFLETQLHRLYLRLCFPVCVEPPILFITCNLTYTRRFLDLEVA